MGRLQRASVAGLLIIELPEIEHGRAPSSQAAHGRHPTGLPAIYRRRSVLGERGCNEMRARTTAASRTELRVQV